MVSASWAGITARASTLQKRAILSRRSEGSGRSHAAEQDVGLDADLQQLLDRVLGRLGLELARALDVGHQGEVNVEDVAAPGLAAELADGLEEGQRLDVTDRPADLDDDEVDVRRRGRECRS